MPPGLPPSFPPSHQHSSAGASDLQSMSPSSRGLLCVSVHLLSVSSKDTGHCFQSLLSIQDDLIAPFLISSAKTLIPTKAHMLRFPGDITFGGLLQPSTDTSTCSWTAVPLFCPLGSWQFVHIFSMGLLFYCLLGRY